MLVASLLPLHNFYLILIRLLEPEPSSSEAGETWPLNFAYKASFHAHKVLLHAVNPQHGTDGVTSPPKEVVLRIFITLKNPSSSPGFEPANLGVQWQAHVNVATSPQLLTTDDAKSVAP
jgi:hypothetical protein